MPFHSPFFSFQGTQVYRSSSRPPKTSRSRMGRTTEAAQPSFVKSWNMVKAAWWRQFNRCCRWIFRHGLGRLFEVRNIYGAYGFYMIFNGVVGSSHGTMWINKLGLESGQEWIVDGFFGVVLCVFGHEINYLGSNWGKSGILTMKKIWNHGTCGFHYGQPVYCWHDLTIKHRELTTDNVDSRDVDLPGKMGDLAMLLSPMKSEMGLFNQDQQEQHDQKECDHQTWWIGIWKRWPPCWTAEFLIGQRIFVLSIMSSVENQCQTMSTHLLLLNISTRNVVGTWWKFPHTWQGIWQIRFKHGYMNVHDIAIQCNT